VGKHYECIHNTEEGFWCSRVLFPHVR